MSDTPQSNEYMQLVQSLTKVGEALATVLTTIWKQVQPIIEALQEAVWQAYRNDGMPYGDTHEGLMRWLNEQTEIRRIESQIEAIKTRQWLATSIREDVQKIREKRRNDEPL